ncbi:hypothetical protein CHS0354_022055 [Potamilus streckersoni]|uniref:Uncharacterized protein n=1 Tax=Potamilus streckersoni TaxID=2493646 RepID=A0AAE0SRS4_9BIVA|nr:hypothetical protein CHS0354_022055 [Potamilus streckersoni]
MGSTATHHSLVDASRTATQTRAIFDVARPEGGKRPWFTGVTFLPGHYVFLADYNNKRCCLLDPSYKLIADFYLPVSPWDVCYIGNKTVAVSLPKLSKIVFLYVDEAIKHTKTVKTRYNCFGVDFLSHDLIVLTCYNRKRSKFLWMIISKEGHEQFYQVIEKSEKHLDWVNSNVTLNNARTQIYISCPGLNSVYCFGLNGKEIFQYKDENFACPQGLAVDKNDDLYVLGGLPRHIAVLSPTGTLRRRINARVSNNSQAICFNMNRDKFLVTGAMDPERCSVLHLAY